MARSWDAVSGYDDAEWLRRKLRNRPHLGTFIARLEIPEATSVTWEKTFGPGHYSLRGAPEDLLRCVVSVDPI